VGLTEFHDILLLVIILHFGGDLGDFSDPPPVLLLRLLIIAYSCVLIKTLS
jgi:hypothetical protein